MNREDPRISQYLMLATYVIGGAGIVIGYTTVYDDPPSLTLAALLGAGIPGVLSWLRHSVFHRSDAKRMGWDLGVRNGFQIETGLANLAWGVIAILAVGFDWGIVAEGAHYLPLNPGPAPEHGSQPIPGASLTVVFGVRGGLDTGQRKKGSMEA